LELGKAVAKELDRGRRGLSPQVRDRGGWLVARARSRVKIGIPGGFAEELAGSWDSRTHLGAELGLEEADLREEIADVGH
jgi:hypothetical protein